MADLYFFSKYGYGQRGLLSVGMCIRPFLLNSYEGKYPKEIASGSNRSHGIHYTTIQNVIRIISKVF